MQKHNNPDNLIVYHGTTHLIDSIDVEKWKPYKDFGRGFYVTQDFNHARNIAVRNKQLEKVQYGNDAASFVYSYDMDMKRAQSFSIKEFTEADLDWMRFVLNNRRISGKSHNYDIIIGPTANDDTSLVLKSYFSGLYGDIESDRALAIALEMIEAENLPYQIYFGTNIAIDCLAQRGKAKKV